MVYSDPVDLYSDLADPGFGPYFGLDYPCSDLCFDLYSGPCSDPLSIIFGSTPEITTEISVITELKTKVLVD